MVHLSQPLSSHMHWRTLQKYTDDGVHWCKPGGDWDLDNQLQMAFEKLVSEQSGRVRTYFDLLNSTELDRVVSHITREKDKAPASSSGRKAWGDLEGLIFWATGEETKQIKKKKRTKHQDRMTTWESPSDRIGAGAPNRHWRKGDRCIFRMIIKSRGLPAFKGWSKPPIRELKRLFKRARINKKQIN